MTDVYAELLWMFPLSTLYPQLMYKALHNLLCFSKQARPMTRYLPIRKEEFDLRCHIESSGHNVDTCYQVILTEKMCKGYLVKMGGKIKSWKKRWFVFDRLRRTFSYYVGKALTLLLLSGLMQPSGTAGALTPGLCSRGAGGLRVLNDVLQLYQDPTSNSFPPQTQYGYRIVRV